MSETLFSFVRGDEPEEQSGRWLRFILVYVAALHGVMFVNDIVHSDPFLTGDRIRDRFEAVTGFARSIGNVEDLVTFLTTHGIVGDYIFHALLYLVGGRFSVIIVQVALLIVAVGYLYKTCLLLTGSHGFSAATALVYVHLPHTLVFPHQLLTEALANPLLIISFYYVVSYLRRPPNYRALLIAAAILGIAVLIRPVLELWPLIIAVAIVLVRRSRSDIAPVLMYTAIGLAPLLAWMTFMAAITGEFSMGKSTHTLSANFGITTRQIMGLLPQSERREIEERYFDGKPPGRYVSASDYVSFAIGNPNLFAPVIGRNFVVFGAVSGINRVTLDYFRIDVEARQSLRHSKDNWRGVWAREGTIDAVIYFYYKYPLLMVITLAGAAVFIPFMLLSIYGAARVIGGLFAHRGKLEERLAWLLILALPAYILMTAQAVSHGGSRLRSPAEFAIAVLAVLGAFALREHWLRRGRRKQVVSPGN